MKYKQITMGGSRNAYPSFNYHIFHNLYPIKKNFICTLLKKLILPSSYFDKFFPDRSTKNSASNSTKHIFIQILSRLTDFWAFDDCTSR